MRRPATALAMVMMAAGACGGALSAQEPDAARERIERWIEALGGMDAHHGLQTARFTLTTEMWDEDSGRLRRTRPRYVWIARDSRGLYARIERWEGNDFIEQGWHPDGKWAFLNGEELSEGDRDYDEADYVGGDVNYWIGLPFKLLDPGVVLTHEGRDAQNREVIRVGFGENVGDHQDTWRYYFVDGRSSPVLVQYTEEGSTNVNHTHWVDPGFVDGYPFVGRRVHVRENGAIWKVIRTSDLVVNPDLDPAVFLRP